MRQRTIKWNIFAALFLAAPAVLFLVQVIMFYPAVFFLAGMFYVLPKVVIPASAGESLAFLVFLGVHVLVNAAVFLLISMLAARIIVFLKGAAARGVAVGAVWVAAAVLTQLPVYGGGGHGPMKWVTLTEALAEINRTYGAWTSALVYGAAALLIAGAMLCRHFWKGANSGEALRGRER
jgi:hypothetical protein